MTNKEKFKEVFIETFGFIPEISFPCPEECPEEFEWKICIGCPYYNFENEEYQEPQK